MNLPNFDDSKGINFEERVIWLRGEVSRLTSEVIDLEEKLAYEQQRNINNVLEKDERLKGYRKEICDLSWELAEAQKIKLELLEKIEKLEKYNHDIIWRAAEAEALNMQHEAVIEKYVNKYGLLTLTE